MPDQPSGAVTFLFTDIEGSTRLVKQLRADYGAVLQQHQRLLREAFDAHGGYEVDTQGDSFFVAFSSARDALLAAVDGQRALLAHPWPGDVQIKVRVGLHTGQAVASDGRYTGLAVNRAARIGAVGHGGQILLSQATHTLLEDEEEDLDVTFEDLGEQRLKDLDRSVRLYQATAEGLPAEFPPLRLGAEPEKLDAARPPWRRPAAIAIAAVVALLIAGVTAALALRGEPASVIPPPNSLAVVDPETERIVEAITVGKRPGPVAFGAGSLWVGNLDDRSVTRVDATSHAVLGNIFLDRRTPTGLAFGFGALWVAQGARGDVLRIDPQFNEPAPSVDVGDTAFGSQNGSVAVDAEWVWAVFGDSTLARIDPSTGRVAEETRAGSLPAGIAVGSGSIWVSNSGDATVTRYNPASFTGGPLDPIYNVSARPTGVAAGEAIWVTNTADNSVSRIDPNSNTVVPVGVGEAPTAVAVTEDAVWVVNSGDGTISRIDPERNEVVGKVEIGNSPSGIVLADGLLWVTVQAP